MIIDFILFLFRYYLIGIIFVSSLAFFFSLPSYLIYKLVDTIKKRKDKYYDKDYYRKGDEE